MCGAWDMGEAVMGDALKAISCRQACCVLSLDGTTAQQVTRSVYGSRSRHELSIGD